MGRWLSKKEYRKRGLRIVELRYKDKLEFTEIAERMGILTGSVGRSYHQFKGEYMSKKELCYYCKNNFEGEHKFLYVVKEGNVVRVHEDCQKNFEHGNELNIRIRVMPSPGEPSYGTKFMKGRKRCRGKA